MNGDMRYTTQLLPSRSGNLGIITLNNPKALHALTMEMIYCLQDVLGQWCRPDSASPNAAVNAILFKSFYDPSQPPKVYSFCAGGNVKDVYYAGKQRSLASSPSDTKTMEEKSHLTHDFFRQEYIVNHMLSQLNGSTCSVAAASTAQQSKLPTQISLWDGIVMGGGVGISIFGKYRVATERTVFAMPETAIGLFPDVGALYILPHILRQFNTGLAPYLLLTGTRLFPHDIVKTGLATHYVPSDQLPLLERTLVDALSATDASERPHHGNAQDAIAPVLENFHTAPPLPTSSVLDFSSEIEQIFTIDGHSTIEAILSTLQHMASTSVASPTKTFANQTFELLHKMSPTSLKITLEGLKRSQDHNSLKENLIMEYRMSQHCMKENSDFYEGIRATLVDKDNRPLWSPPTLSEVTEGIVSSFFQPIENEWDLPGQFNLLPLQKEAPSSESRL